MSDLIKALTFGCVSMFVQIESPPNAVECIFEVVLPCSRTLCCGMLAIGAIISV